MPRV